MAKQQNSKKVIIFIVLIVLLFIGGFLFNQNYLQSHISTSPTQIDPRAGDPNDPLYQELISTDVVKQQQIETGPGTRMAILQKHSNNIIELNIYLPEDGGHAAWVQKVNGNWVLVYAGQEIPKCNLLEDAGIEPGLKCLNPNWEQECVGAKATNDCSTRKTQ